MLKYPIICLRIEACQRLVDQANAKRDGEANPPPSETGNGEATEDGEVLTEADLKKMNRPELDEIAVKLELDPSKYSNKDSLLEAILKLGEE